MDKRLLCDREIPKNLEEKIDRLCAGETTPLFAIVGDLSNKGTFEQTVALFTANSLFIFSEGEENYTEYPFKDFESVRSKRMYGNSVLLGKNTKGSETVLFRVTFSKARLCDAAAQFVNHIKVGADLNEEYVVIGVAFENAASFCPKCGRALLHPGAPCINCRSKVHLLRHFGKYLKPMTKTIIFCGIISIITTLSGLLPPAVTGLIVDSVFSSGSSGYSILTKISTVFGTAPVNILFAMVLVLFINTALNHFFNAVRSNKMRAVGEKFSNDMRKDVYQKAMRLPMAFYDHSSTGSVINRISSDASTLQNFVNRITQEAVGHAFQLIGIVVLMVSVNPKMTLLSLTPVPLIVIISRVFSLKIRPFYHRIWRNWSAVTSRLTDTIPCIRIIKSFAGEKRASESFDEVTDKHIKTSLEMGKMITAFPQAVSFLVACGSLAIWILGGTKVLMGDEGYTAGLVVSFISYAAMFYTPVSFFANLADTFQNAMTSAEKILDIIEAEPELEANASVMPDSFKGEIELNHVTVSFGKTKKVLDDVTFHINPGEIVGIVGTTGSGKSTLVNLLLRFYEGYSGEILVDGHNIKNYNLQAYRNLIGYVQQEPMMFSDTIFNNLLFSVPDATVEQVIAAAKTANADGFIARQPEGYDTMLGERGVGVSGGEKQRLSIARAVLKNPSMMIFDEATAAVDSETEKLIQDAIDKLIEGKTTIMIAHRLSTLKRATRILVVDNGRIIENGTPEELLAKKGKYYKLVQIQSMSADVEKMRKEERF
ncbi:MAG: ABC transporter ATP-binding protein/permease [Clostridia bacterium]|nr:ABC transporter ATP-binding protein/permease [Clostridia bacterium]